MFFKSAFSGEKEEKERKKEKSENPLRAKIILDTYQTRKNYHQPFRSSSCSSNRSSGECCHMVETQHEPFISTSMGFLTDRLIFKVDI